MGGDRIVLRILRLRSSDSTKDFQQARQMFIFIF
jgi:hypothetical protein